MNGNGFNWFDSSIYRCNDWGNFDRFVNVNMKSKYDNNTRPTIENLHKNTSYIANLYSNDRTLTSAWCGDYVENMSNAYSNCNNIISSPVCVGIM